MQDCYISVDIEADGKAPGLSSMLSLGAAAFNEYGDLLGVFQENLRVMPDAKPDPDTLAWWATQPAAYKVATENAREPMEVMKAFCEWCQSFPGRPVFVAYPTGFDFTWVYWYAMKFCPDKWPFAWAALDIRTLAMAAANTDWEGSINRNWPKRFKPKRRHSHVASEDAIQQGEAFIKILNEIRETHKKARAYDTLRPISGGVAIGGNVSNSVISTGKVK